MNKKNILIIAGVVLAVVILGGGGYYAYTQMNKKKPVETNNNNNNNNDNKNKNKTNITCGKLKAENDQTSGKSPFSPVLRAKISGDFNQATQVCKWSVNGKAYGSSFPIDNECIFGGNPLTQPGEYKIQFNALNKDVCGDEMVVTVTQ